MNRIIVRALGISVIAFLFSSGAAAFQSEPGPPEEFPSVALTTAITYQGRLVDGGTPVSTPHDFIFLLYNADLGGAQVGSQVTANDLAVSDGYFTVLLDFGSAAFMGEKRWLEVQVRPGDSSGAYTTLSPRQALTAAPYALYSLKSPWGGLSGVPAGFADGVDNDTTTFWSLTGNSGTNPSTNYLGTADNVALELRVNGLRALRLEPNIYGMNQFAPNLIGGYSGNWITSGVYGATLLGGGNFNEPIENRVTDNFGTVSGGALNQAGNNAFSTTDTIYATVGGGFGNFASGPYATIGGGEVNTASDYMATVSGGWANTASGERSTICGGWGNTASDEQSTIGGGWGNTASGSHALVGGGYSNLASWPYSMVAGGYDNEANSSYAAVGGGESNLAGWDYAVVAGGYDNEASGIKAAVLGGDSNLASGPFAVIAGGYDNEASSDKTVIGGGYSNIANNQYATIGGGYDNAAYGIYTFVGGGISNVANNDYSTIGGGYSNLASVGSATVAGGYDNHATNSYATIAGGNSNLANQTYATIAGGDDNEASGSKTTVGGGFSNLASGTHSVIGGGYDNTASGGYSSIPGGTANIASGSTSFAAGYQANASHGGSFVWSTGTSTDSWGDNTFTVRAHGGARFYTAAGTGTGVTLISGSGSWSGLSDRAAKENFQQVDPQLVLEKLAQVPVTSWNYRAQDDAIRHLGPVAQDFMAAFDLGEDERFISTVDADGVALAAAKGLYQLSQEQAARIESLEAENAGLNARLTDIEARLASLESGGSAGARALSVGEYLPYFGLAALGLGIAWRKRWMGGER